MSLARRLPPRLIISGWRASPANTKRCSTSITSKTRIGQKLPRPGLNRSLDKPQIAPRKAIGAGGNGRSTVPLKCSAVDSVLPEQLLDTEKLIVFGHAIGPAEGAGLDLAGIGGDRDIRNCRILCFAGAMADHGSVFVFLSELDRVEGLCERSDLVDFYQN